MLKKFFRVATISFVIALAVSMAASFLIQTNDTNNTTNAKLNVLLDDLEVLIDDNDEQIKSIRTELDEAYLEKSRLFAEMIYLNPDIINDFDELCHICDIMNVDEIHIVDEDGILRYGSVPGYYGYDMASAAQSGEFMQIIANPAIELVQAPQPNGAGAGWFQYVGVARKDAKGFVQVGIQPYRLEEAMQKAAPENILKQIKIDKSMRILLLSGDEVVGDSQNALIGQALSGGAIKAGMGEVELDASCHYIAKQIGNYLVASVISNDDMYEARNTSLIVFLITNALILFALVFVIGFWLIVNIIKPLGNVAQSLNIIANGNLECKVEARDTPEFASLSDGINSMVSNIGSMLGEAGKMTEVLKDVIGSVENGAKSIDLSTRELFKESQGLSVGARSQNAIAAEMSKLLDDIHNNSVVNAKYASEASDVSRSALQNANDGSDKMMQLMSAVREIDSASQDISKITKKIDDIAFQTNILALNAAVEAARAGEHGKGFAVVAEEVRNLSGKSAEAAKQTEELINSSIQRSQTGVAIADETAGKISEIVENIRKSASFMEDIVTSSQKQADAVGQLNENMENIRQGVEVTVQSAEHITSESEKLQSSSNEMSGVIGRIK